MTIRFKARRFLINFVELVVFFFLRKYRKLLEKAITPVSFDEDLSMRLDRLNSVLDK